MTVHAIQHERTVAKVISRHDPRYCEGMTFLFAMTLSFAIVCPDMPLQYLRSCLPTFDINNNRVRLDQSITKAISVRYFEITAPNGKY